MQLLHVPGEFGKENHAELLEFFGPGLEKIVRHDEVVDVATEQSQKAL